MIYEEAVRSWKERQITDDAQLAEALNGKGILFAYHSSKLENDAVTFHDTREIFEHDGVTSYTGDLRTLFELRNAKDAYSLFLDAYHDKKKLDTELLLAFQYELTKTTYDARRWRNGERPGEFKKHDYVTGKYEIGASPETAEEETCELLEELQDLKPAVQFLKEQTVKTWARGKEGRS